MNEICLGRHLPYRECFPRDVLKLQTMTKQSTLAFSYNFFVERFVQLPVSWWNIQGNFAIQLVLSARDNNIMQETREGWMTTRAGYS